MTGEPSQGKSSRWGAQGMTGLEWKQGGMWGAELVRACRGQGRPLGVLLGLRGMNSGQERMSKCITPPQKLLVLCCPIW